MNPWHSSAPVPQCYLKHSGVLRQTSATGYLPLLLCTCASLQTGACVHARVNELFAKQTALHTKKNRQCIQTSFYFISLVLPITTAERMDVTLKKLPDLLANSVFTKIPNKRPQVVHADFHSLCCVSLAWGDLLRSSG